MIKIIVATLFDNAIPQILSASGVNCTFTTGYYNRMDGLKGRQHKVA